MFVASDLYLNETASAVCEERVEQRPSGQPYPWRSDASGPTRTLLRPDVIVRRPLARPSDLSGASRDPPYGRVHRRVRRTKTRSAAIRTTNRGLLRSCDSSY